MSTQVTTKQITPMEDFRNTITRMEPQLKMALPSHITPQKFMRVLFTAIQQNQDLLSGDRNALMSSVMKAAQCGLLPDGREGAIIPFKGVATWMPMVSGILKIVRNSGELLSISAHTIHLNDKFKYFIDSKGEHIEHEPLLFGDRGIIIGTYAIATTKDGGVYVEVMTEDQIQAVRKMSRAKVGPWDGPFADEMRKKTAIRRLSKRLPMSTDAVEVIQEDDQLYELPEPKNEPVPSSSRLAQLVEAQVTKPEIVQNVQNVQNDQEPV